MKRYLLEKVDEIERYVELSDPSETFDTIDVRGAWFSEFPGLWDYEDFNEDVWKLENRGQKRYSIFTTSMEAYFDVISRLCSIGWYHKIMNETDSLSSLKKSLSSSFPEKRQSYTIQTWASEVSYSDTQYILVRVDYKELPIFRKFLQDIPYKVGYQENPSIGMSWRYVERDIIYYK